MNAEQLARYDTRGFCETSKQMADGDGECMCFFPAAILSRTVFMETLSCVAMRCENVENVEKIDEGRR